MHPNHLKTESEMSNLPLPGRDHWYGIAWSDEVSAQPLARVVLDDPIVVFRGESGALSALVDGCPHRNAPLSLGSVQGDQLQCIYHGMRFAGDGQCTRIPSQEQIPSSMRVRAYPVAEKHGVIWVWMGDPLLADPEKLYDWEWIGVEGTEHLRIDVTVDAPVALLVDNLMDLTHVPFLHRILGAMGDLATVHEMGVLVSEADDRSVTFARKTAEKDDGTYVEVGSKFVLPSICEAWAQPRAHDGSPLATNMVSQVLHILTPISASRTRYLAIKVFTAVPTEELRDAVRNQMAVTIEEDKMISEAVWNNAVDHGLTKEHPVRADKASLLARRILERQGESAESSVTVLTTDSTLAATAVGGR